VINVPDIEPSEHELLQQADRLQTLNEIGRVVSATLDLRVLYDTIYKQIGRVMDTTQFFIALHRPERNALEIPYLREEGKLALEEEVPYERSVTTCVIEQGIPLLFHTPDEYEQYARQNELPELFVGDQDSEAQIFVPLNTGSRTIGALTVQSQRRHAYTEDDVQILSVIASQAAIAIENARLYGESQSSVRQMQALLHVAQMINGSLDLETVLNAILSGVRDVLPYHLAAIFLPNFIDSTLDVVATVGTKPENWLNVAIPFGQGVIGKVFEGGKPIVLTDTRTFAGYIETAGEETRSELAVPLKWGSSVVGILNVERIERSSFSNNDLDLLTLFASQAAIAIENARLFGEQRNRVYELQAIQSIVQKLTTLHDVQAIALLIETELKQLIDYHACRLFRLDRENKQLLPIALAGSVLPETGLRIGDGITGWIAQHGEPVIVPNSLEDARASHIVGTPKRAESIIGAPLMYEDRVQGVITLSKLGVDQFDENALRLLEIIAAQTAIAFDRARLYDELREQAVTDELTQLYNRRYLLDRFAEEKARAIRNQHNLAAMMVDIDQFKDVNDTYGHDAGDVVLQDLATVIRAAVRIEDIVTRYGGEEFCILLPEIAIEDAEGVAERMRALIERRRFPKAAGVDHITVSVGLALLGPNDEDSELFSRADQAMYQVKRRSGNGVCVAEAEGFRELRAAL
jgi:diguanylate cyclase (GGDEF)-like protein